MDPQPLTLDCRSCGPVTPAVSWLEGAIRHLRAECPKCRAWLKWLPQTPENVALVGLEPEPGSNLFDGIDPTTP